MELEEWLREFTVRQDRLNKLADEATTEFKLIKDRLAKAEVELSKLDKLRVELNRDAECAKEICSLHLHQETSGTVVDGDPLTGDL